MTTRSTILRTPPQLLRYALMSDSIISAITGIICIADAEPLATIIGLHSPAMFIAFGLIAFAYAATLFYVARRSPINRLVAWMACIFNLGGALIFAVILLIGALPLTDTGKWIIAIVADVAGVLGLLQFLGLRQSRDEVK
ncbi:MAG: hypothetical protein HY868_17580 [Chloroflexi bacterium]|nr:hypothetical protein [Chloroflexota bacterium]